MQHRFRIPQNGGSGPFKKWDVNDSDTWDARQNDISSVQVGFQSEKEVLFTTESRF